MPRAKGSKSGVRHTPHPLVQFHKQKYVETLEDFCQCIFPRNSIDVGKVLEAIKEGRMGYGKMQAVAEGLGIGRDKFNAIVRRLKDLGILTESYTFSEVFQKKATAISLFYGKYTGKANPTQKALDDANEYLRTKGYSGQFSVRFNTKEQEKAEN
ncbi:hypothetical protein MUP37_06695 [Candidatus Bathyarchaeota archaeon]|nr:hypothetical protein [Candidatus Bathyarchaeota archaeon]